jgi:pimeloyl-ACP methyl ester carboxylesterase
MTSDQIAQTLAANLASLGIVPIDREIEGEPPIGGLRRRRGSRFDDEVGVITLLDVDGVLMWEEGAVSASTSRMRRRRAGPAADGEVVAQLKFPRAKALGTNQIAEQLAKLDAKLTPNGPGRLLAWDTAKWEPTPVAAPDATGRLLLIIHGTFSNSGNLVRELWAPDPNQPGQGHGADLLRKVAANYTQVLSFDHFTLSRSPLINAVELARLFAATDAERLDVVCHSRGGLVTRWWCEVLDQKPRKQRRVVFVGCPLQGTSLADPESLRNGLNLLSNVGRVLGDGLQLIPMLTVAGGLIQVLSSITSVASRTPLVDAGVAMVPGLAAMSRVGNNHELNALNVMNAPARADYFAVTSDFEPDPVTWRFWRMFSDKFSTRAADAAVDHLVFRQANDLVVDTTSMTYHAWGPNPVLANNPVFRCFEPQDAVHHTNYFRNSKTTQFITQALGL